MDCSYKILRIDKNVEYKMKEKGSLFHGFAFNINSKLEAEENIKQLREKFYDATHHCYAFKTHQNDEKYSDDGEPNGTAGIRILNSINHFNLTDVLVVIVRYFGGTKLGVGPLGKAYGETSMLLLEDAEFIELTKYEGIQLKYDFANTSQIHYLINKFNAKKITNLYEEQPIIKFFIEPYHISNFILEIENATKGNVDLIQTHNEIFI